MLTKLYSDRLTGNEEGQWASEAPSSIEVYTSDAIPGWKNSLLISTLKGNKLIRLRLNDKGDKIVGDTVSYFKNKIRYRDIAISPDGKRIYLSVDSTAASSNPAKENPEKIYNPGSIIEFTYTGTSNTKTDDRRKKKAK
jgi:glucose/arabinose dehydrogenase